MKEYPVMPLGVVPELEEAHVVIEKVLSGEGVLTGKYKVISDTEIETSFYTENGMKDNLVYLSVTYFGDNNGDFNGGYSIFYYDKKHFKVSYVALDIKELENFIQSFDVSVY